MQYDPIKRSLGKVFNRQPWLRILFYKLLDILLLRTWHIKREIRQLKHLIPDNPSILDAGSGFGQYSYYLAKKFPSGKVTGIDIKEEQISDCNEFANEIDLSERLSFKVADLTLFRETEKFDIILSVDVMEHISEDVTVFVNLHESLRKGGTLLISTPSDQGGSDVHGEGEASFIDEHVRDGYNSKEIENKLREAGFSKVKVKYSYGGPGKISWKLSMKYPVSMLNVSKIFFIILPFYYLITFPFCLLLNLADVHMHHDRGTGLIVNAVK
jgi:2-polyprenyl-3-methyl-5-hydroxy-6-metoxy-1,4-benzoquinol methylase